MTQGFFSRRDIGGLDDEFLRQELEKINKQNKTSNMTSVVAKFECNSVVPNPPQYGGVQIHLNAVYGNGTGNEDFASATPYGNLVMGISEGRPAAEYFKQGKKYLLTFTEVVE